jgi:hypothetical protein
MKITVTSTEDKNLHSRGVVGINVMGARTAYTFELKKAFFPSYFFTVKPILNISLHSQASNNEILHAAVTTIHISGTRKQ